MEQPKHFFAVDLGATSGRTIIGTIENGKMSLEELTRFDNNLIETGGHFYWDIFALYNEVINGLRLVAKRQIEIQSIGIDTWGVDFVCVGSDGAICAILWLTATRTPWARWRSISRRLFRETRSTTSRAYSS